MGLIDSALPVSLVLFVGVLINAIVNHNGEIIDYALPIGIAVFVATVGSLQFLLNNKKDEIAVWYIRLLNEWKQQDYLDLCGKELQLSLCKHDLTIVVNKADDEAHAIKRAEVEKEGGVYFEHLHESKELAWIPDHSLPFDRVFVQKIVTQFCTERWMLISSLVLLKVEDEPDVFKRWRILMNNFICVHRETLIKSLYNAKQPVLRIQ